MSGPRPPRVAAWLLERCLDDAHRDAVLGDLEEEFARRPSRLRYCRQAIWAVVHLRPRLTLPARTQGNREGVVEGFVADLRLALRLLRRAPLFTAVCVLTLGLAIGAATAIYGIASPLLLEPLPYPHPRQLVMVAQRDQDGTPGNIGFTTFDDLRRSARTLERAAVASDWLPTLVGERDAERLSGTRVSADYFRLLGVAPAVGRDFRAEEDAPGRNRVVMLGHGLWRRRFGADPAIVGRTIDLDGIAHEVAGVMPAAFDDVLHPETQIWRVIGYDRAQSGACRSCRHLRMIVRVRDGVTVEAAATELAGLYGAIAAEHPREYSGPGLAVQSVQERAVARVRAPVAAVLGAVALVLLIAVANVTNLQLARAARRESEFAVRTALGAGRGRLAQQLLAEGLLLAAAGGALGLLLAWLALPALVSRMPAYVPRLSAVRLDAAVFLAAALATGAVALVVGLVPVMRDGARSLASSLQGAARVVGPRRGLARAGLVVGEVALAMVLLVGAGLLARSLSRLLDEDMGFDPRGLLTLEIQSTGTAYREDAQVYAYHDRVLAAVRAVPGVEGAALTSQLPLGGNLDTYGFRAQDRQLENPAQAPSADRYAVTADFARVMRVPLRRGRGIEPSDVRDSADRVVLVSEALARRIWGGEDPIGRRIQMGDTLGAWRTVVGVVANVRHSGLDAPVTQQVWVPERQWQWADNQVVLVVRARGDAAALAPAVRAAVLSVDPLQPISRVATMEQVVAASTAQRRMALVLFAAFAVASLLLASAGIYGVLAGSVAERTREIGVRSALGARPGQILALIVRQGARLAVAGLVLGIAASLGLSRWLESLLYEVRPGDPVTLLGVALLLGLVALGACLVPALRALRIQPMSALRSE